MMPEIQYHVILGICRSKVSNPQPMSKPLVPDAHRLPTAPALDLMNGPGDGPKPVTHYTVLGLAPAILASHDDPSSLIRQAYRRALLRHHPDKATVFSIPGSSSPAVPKPQTYPSYSIDQIAQAFTVLSSPRQRSDYDARLRLSQAAGTGDDLQARFQTGIENVDLDDLAFDSDEERWHRPCRCGNNRGYSLHEDDLAEVEHEGELMLGCQDCSLWLRVHFAVLEDAEDDASASAEATQAKNKLK